jgi:uncharacterized membrane protein YphA (DoxX/SURF4 family)
MWIRRLATLATWALQLLLGLAFIALGLAKFDGVVWADNFARWGYPPGFHFVIGGIEAAAGACLLVPRLSSYAAAALAVVMIGASLTHAVHGETARVFGPVPHFLLLCLLAYARRASAWRPRRARVASAVTD